MLLLHWERSLTASTSWDGHYNKLISMLHPIEKPNTISVVGALPDPILTDFDKLPKDKV